MSPLSKGICVLFCTLLVVYSPVETKEIDCPSQCHCSTSFTTVKCRGLDHFPVFEFAAKVKTLDLSRGHILDIEKTDLQRYVNLKRLDLKHNEIQSVSPGLFSEMEHLRELFLDGNPWSCDSSTLHVLQEEVTALLAKNLHLENFDGGKLKCDGPPDKRGTRPLHMKLFARDHHPRVHKGHKERQLTPGWVILLSVLVMLGVVLIGFVIWIINQQKYQFILNSLKCKKGAEPAQDLEEVKTDTHSFLVESMKKRRRMSQGIPQSDIVKSDDEEVVDQEEYIREKMKQQRRMSLGYAEDDPHSSEEECLVEINLEN